MKYTIMLKFSQINQWQEQLAEHNLRYVPNHANKRSNPEYEKAKQMLDRTKVVSVNGKIGL